MVQKVQHNATERERRRKINTLCSSLRSLLPASHQKKKLSIPETISRVVKYIPELQQEVKRLQQVKENLVSRKPEGEDCEIIKRDISGISSSPSSKESSSLLSDREIVIQISKCKDHWVPLSGILLTLEEDGLLLKTASSFESFDGKIFYNLHLQGRSSCRLERQVLNEKLMSFYGGEDICQRQCQ